MPICGFLIAYLGWESVFYVTGAIGLVWSVAWFFLIFDSPRQHPRITIEERQYIEDSIGSTSTTKVRSKSTYASNSIHYLPLFGLQRLPVPWKSIFLSTPVWAIVLTHSCNVFGYFTVVNQLPTYMKYILNFNIKEVRTNAYLRNDDFLRFTPPRSLFLRRTDYYPPCRTLANTSLPLQHPLWLTICSRRRNCR